MRHVVVGLGEVDLGPRLAGRGKPRRRGGHSATLTPRVGGQRRERLEEQGAPRAQEHGADADGTGILGVALGDPNDTPRQTLTQGSGPAAQRVEGAPDQQSMSLGEQPRRVLRERHELADLPAVDARAAVSGRDGGNKRVDGRGAPSTHRRPAKAAETGRPKPSGGAVWSTIGRTPDGLPLATHIRGRDRWQRGGPLDDSGASLKGGEPPLTKAEGPDSPARGLGPLRNSGKE